MTQRALDAALDTLGWLDSAAESLQANVKRVFDALGPSRRGVKNFLHGTWLGHPLHPVLTDIPLGAWTMTMVLDAMETRGARAGLARAADASLGVGLAGAVAAAATGLTDWSDTYARPRKIGLAHAGLNAGATVLFAASYLLRVSGSRAAGRVLAATGYVAAVAGAYLGGELVYQEHIGVNHSSGGKLPEDFTPIIAEAELSDGMLKRVTYEDIPLLLVKRGESIHALVETCGHLGGPLTEGKLDGDTVVCPWHGSRFDLSSGAVVEGPSAFPQPCFEVRTREGQVEVRAPTQHRGSYRLASAPRRA